MKKISVIITMLMLMIFSVSCQKTDSKKLLENKETRESIFNAICENHELMSDFMSVARTNDHAMMMMNNGSMMNQGNNQHMINQSGMMNMMMNHPEMMEMMMENMMNRCDTDATWMNNMGDIMASHPKMTELCQKIHTENADKMEHASN